MGGVFVGLGRGLALWAELRGEWVRENILTAASEERREGEGVWRVLRENGTADLALWTFLPAVDNDIMKGAFSTHIEHRGCSYGDEVGNVCCVIDCRGLPSPWGPRDERKLNFRGFFSRWALLDAFFRSLELSSEDISVSVKIRLGVENLNKI